MLNAILISKLWLLNLIGVVSNIALFSNFFFENCGIFHRVSCPHTHQQNETIERKHRHLVKTSLALLYYARVPFHCWGFVFLRRKVYNEYNFN